jgi:hypothetical protein
MGDGPGCLEKGADRLGNRRFESTSLRQRVHLRQVNFAVAAGKALRLRLIEDGLLRAGDCNGNSFPAAAIDYGAVIPFKRPILEKAWSNFRAPGSAKI